MNIQKLGLYSQLICKQIFSTKSTAQMHKMRMRHLLPILILVALLFQSCEEPVAQFSFDPMDNPERFEEIQFSNESFNAISFTWDFGDGDKSTDDNPKHIYDSADTYDVTLTASDGKTSSTFSQSITITETTILNLEVYNSNSARMNDCDVWLYDNEEDWSVANRPQYFGFTKNNGTCFFINLESQVYYIRVRKYTEDGVWEGSMATNSIALNKANLEKVVCEFSTLDY